MDKQTSATIDQMGKALGVKTMFRDHAVQVSLEGTEYHGLVLGLCSMLDNRYEIRSNRESGEGRYDIRLMPRVKNLPGVLIELKAAKDCSTDDLNALSKAALRKVNEKSYDTDMTASGVERIFKYGVAFCGKQVEITME